ncbi:hypothetical protein BDZ97DRAFT_1771677 [Flammula alnicola]|nr:hypothetical protein BDZ97DRAFT_1771677 [Flammula alnicola]
MGNAHEEAPRDPYDGGDENDEEEMEHVQANLVPVNLASIRFPRTVIGAGPVLRLQAAANGSNTPTSAIPTLDTPNPNLPGGDTGEINATISALATCVAKLTEKLSPGQVSRTKKYGAPKSREFKLPPRRFTTPDRNARLASVRDIMNTLFGITRDADILYKPLANTDEIRAFERDEGEGRGPTAPYLPDFSNIRGAWNHALLLLFMEEYTKKFTIQDEDEQDDISKMFLDRLLRLRKRVKGLMRLRLPDDTDAQLSQRYLARHTRVLREQRRNSRRNEIFETRSIITVQNVMAQRGEAKIIWEHLDSILETLGAGGMSSDESELEADGRKVYFVKRMGWRRRALTGRMTMIDRDRNVTTAYNNTRAGNPPRLRKQRNNPAETTRNALPGLPLNFYDQDWYNQLTDRQTKEIGAAPAVELLEILS